MSWDTTGDTGDAGEWKDPFAAPAAEGFGPLGTDDFSGGGGNFGSGNNSGANEGFEREEGNAGDGGFSGECFNCGQVG